MGYSRYSASASSIITVIAKATTADAATATAIAIVEPSFDDYTDDYVDVDSCTDCQREGHWQLDSAAHRRLRRIADLPASASPPASTAPPAAHSITIRFSLSVSDGCY